MGRLLGLALLGCGEVQPSGVIEAVEPAAACTDRSTVVQLKGRGFVPSLAVDLGAQTEVARSAGYTGFLDNGSARVPLTGLIWRSLGELDATVPAGTPPAMYHLLLRDVRGNEIGSGRLEWQSLGPDATAPLVNVLEPTADTPAVAGAALPVRLTARDARGGQLVRLDFRVAADGIAIASRACPLSPGGGAAECNEAVPLPISLALGTVLTVDVVAGDNAPVPNLARAAVTVVVRAAPRLDSWTPRRAGTPGGADFVVRGQGFPEGAQVFIDGVPLWPDGGVRAGDDAITGRLPAHAAGRASLELRTPVGSRSVPDAIEYSAPPHLFAAAPKLIASADSNRIALTGDGFAPGETTFWLGPELATSVPLGCEVLTPTAAACDVPPGRGGATLWVVDPVLGATSLVDAFTWFQPPPGP